MENLQIKLQCNIVTGNPVIHVYNRHSTSRKSFELMLGEQDITVPLDLSYNDTIYIQLAGHEHNFTSDEQTTVEIKEILIDDINLQHIIQHGKQFPQFDQNYGLEHNPPEYFQPGTVFYNNAVFEFAIKMPVYKFLLDSYEQDIS